MSLYFHINVLCCSLFFCIFNASLKALCIAFTYELFYIHKIAFNICASLCRLTLYYFHLILFHLTWHSRTQYLVYPYRSFFFFGALLILFQRNVDVNTENIQTMNMSEKKLPDMCHCYHAGMVATWQSTLTDLTFEWQIRQLLKLLCKQGGAEGWSLALTTNQSLLHCVGEFHHKTGQFPNCR